MNKNLDWEAFYVVDPLELFFLEIDKVDCLKFEMIKKSSETALVLCVKSDLIFSAL